MVDTNSSPKVQAASSIISSRAPRFWTPELDAEVKRGIENGEKFKSIGRRLGTSRAAVQARASLLGLKSRISKNRSDTWTPALVALLKEGVAAGDRYSKIAMRLGLTKNQCIAKASRLELGLRYTPPARKPRQEIAPFPPPGRCVYPIGHVDEPRFRFCGARVRAFGAPYCDEHHAIAMVRVPTKAPAA